MSAPIDPIDPIDPAQWQREIDAALGEIRPVLAGLGPILQGAILGQLVSMWLAGHQNEAQRQGAEAQFLDYYRSLIPIDATMLRSVADAARGRKNP